MVEHLNEISNLSIQTVFAIFILLVFVAVSVIYTQRKIKNQSEKEREDERRTFNDSRNGKGRNYKRR